MEVNKTLDTLKWISIMSYIFGIGLIIYGIIIYFGIIFITDGVILLIVGFSVQKISEYIQKVEINLINLHQDENKN